MLGVQVDAETDATGETFAVMAENWRTVKAFLALETQWRVSAGAGGVIWTGLDYGAATARLRRRSFRAFDRLMVRLRIMEEAALPILNRGGRP
ncbi:DUF1799 domain-containing protein [Oricola indica]|uniref:DUF1799 domain-containing protein n=1 Tax=Oricola indica TaxID=2872591 RepID=UPI003CCBBA9A